MKHPWPDESAARRRYDAHLAMPQALPAFAVLENAPAGGRCAGRNIAGKKYPFHTLRIPLPPL